MFNEIDTTQAKQNLRKTTFSPPQINEFCKLLAETLPDKTDPLMFLLEFSLLCRLIDKSETRSVTIRGKEVRCSMCGCELTSIFNMALPRILKEAFTEDFAKATLAERDSVYAEASRR